MFGLHILECGILRSEKGKFSFQNALHSQFVPHITTMHVAHINHVSDKDG